MVRGNNSKEIFYLEDVSNPLYLHTGDHQGLLLVSTQLNGANYNNWNKSMITSLTAKNKLGFIDGSLIKPEVVDPLFQYWIRANSMVVSWLRNSVIPEISSSLMYLTTAQSIWNDLRDRFSQGDVARVYQLKQDLMCLRQGSNDVNTYYTQLRVLWDEYKDYQPLSWCDCGDCRCNSAGKWNAHQDKECIMQFLVGLNESYSHIRSHIISIKPLLPLPSVFALIIQEERQRSIGIAPTPNPLSVTSEQAGINAASNTQFTRGKNKFLCSHCGRTNHTVDKCFQLHGFPPESADSGTQQSAMGNVASTLSSDQCYQLISLLQTQMQSLAPPLQQPLAPPLKQPDTTPSFSGHFHGATDWDG